MPRRRPFAAILFGLAALTLQTAQAAPPVPDLTDLPAYMAALNRSQDPQAAAIRREIVGGPAALAREKAAAQAAGIPLTVSVPALPPDAQNAAPLWAQWDALRKQDPIRLPNYAEVLRAGYAYTPAQLGFVQQQYDNHPALVGLLHRAADRTTLLSTDQDYLHFAGLREAARELRTESFLMTAQGRYAEAVADQSRGFNIAKQITSRPDLINYLVGDAIEAITLAGMWDTLDAAGPDAAVDMQVQQAVQSARPVLSLKAALAGDVAPSLATLDKVRSGTPDDLASLSQAGTGKTLPAKIKAFTPAERRFVNRLLDATEAEYLSQMRLLIAESGQPVAVRRVAFDSLWQKTNRPSLSPVKELNPMFQLSQILFPTFDPLDRIDGLNQAQEQVTLAAAAVLAAKAQAGAFPVALPGDFPDPFTFKPLGYRREGDTGFVVYSVGADGTFDGGRPGGPTFLPHQAFFRYPGPTPQPVPADMLK